MESITIKVQEEMALEIDSSLIPNYGTRTDFIRDAIREKIENERKQRLLRIFEKNFGKLKSKTKLSDRQIRKNVGEEIAKQLGV